jgi:hypothetical protein
VAQDYDLKFCLEQAQLNWRLADKAEGEGNTELAHELAALAREWDEQAALKRPVPPLTRPGQPTLRH